MKDWFWKVFVLHLQWLDFCLGCERYYWRHKQGVYATCIQCLREDSQARLARVHVNP
jgi:hypothetical protein